ncbi:MAG: glycosyltransferase family 2 protein [Candidatus Paceibacteria bacterium]
MSNQSLENKLVTIITPVHNGSYTLQRTINSIRRQKYEEIEYIVVDGGSTDGTREIIKKNEDIIDYWTSEPDKGPYDAMNKGIKVATGDLIGILNSDDLFLDHTLETVVSKYKGTKDLCIIYGNLVKFGKGGHEILFEGDMTQEAFRKCSIQLNHPTCFVPKRIYDKYGLFDTSFETGADRELMYRMHREGVEFVKVDKVLAKFRLGGLTSNFDIRKSFRVLVDSFRMHKRHNLPYEYFIPHVLRGFIGNMTKSLVKKTFGENLLSKTRSYWLSNKFKEYRK